MTSNTFIEGLCSFNNKKQIKKKTTFEVLGTKALSILWSSYAEKIIN